MDESFVEDALFVHLFHQRPNFLVGELADVVAEQNFVFGKASQGGGSSSLQGGFGHGHTFKKLRWQTRNFSTRRRARCATRDQHRSASLPISQASFRTLVSFSPGRVRTGPSLRRKNNSAPKDAT